jgi:APA family basic amino acid/polyamine antiporter
MAKDGLFFTKAGDLNANGVPGKALIIQAIWASLLCLSEHMALFSIMLSQQF